MAEATAEATAEKGNVVEVGRVASNRGGGTAIDTRRKVRVGAYLGGSRQGDTRGTTVSVYAARGGYRVHVASWSQWQGETTYEYLACSCGEDETGEDRHPNGEVLSAEGLSRNWPAAARDAGIEVVEDLRDEDVSAKEGGGGTVRCECYRYWGARCEEDEAGVPAGTAREEWTMENDRLLGEGGPGSFGRGGSAYSIYVLPGHLDRSADEEEKESGSGHE